MKSIKLKRAYDPPSSSDGYRVLVDRLWPRGSAKGELRINLWARELAPSAGLRKWFGHDPAKWTEFKKRYHRELEGRSEAVEAIRKLLRRRLGRRNRRWWRRRRGDRRATLTAKACTRRKRGAAGGAEAGGFVHLRL